MKPLYVLAVLSLALFALLGGTVPSGRVESSAFSEDATVVALAIAAGVLVYFALTTRWREDPPGPDGPGEG